MVTNLSAAVMDVQRSTARLPEITEAVAGEAQDLPGLVEQTQASMRELERLIFDTPGDARRVLRRFAEGDLGPAMDEAD